MDKYQEMRVFTAVVEASSFVAAADSLGMSKAAVSRYVSELERRLGVRLLHRTTRRLSLTPEGEVFRSHCQDILSSIEASEAEISTRSLSVSGLLKVSVPVSFGIHHLAQLWPEFLALHPQLKLDVQLADRVIDLVDEGFDMAIRIGRLADSSLISKQIAATRLVLCAAPHYLEHRGTPKHPSELAGHEVLGYSLLATGDQWHFDGPDGPVIVKVQPRLWSNNGDSCIAACVQGAGIQLQPTFLIAEELRQGQLVEILPEFKAVTLGIYAVYPTRKFVLPKVRSTIDFLTSHLEAANWVHL
jgi:DNA-binding transcriptional LysR family regulator